MANLFDEFDDVDENWVAMDAQRREYREWDGDHGRGHRDPMAALNLPEEIFLERYYVSRALVMKLMSRLDNQLRHTFNTSESGLVVIKLLSAIMYYSTGEFTDNLIGNEHVSVHCQRTAVKKVSQALSSYCILPNMMSLPVTKEKREEVLRSFENGAFPFPGAMGAIGTMHVHVERKLNKEKDSINVQMICDGNMRVIAMTLCYGFTNSDADIWLHKTKYRCDVMHWQKFNVFLLGGRSFPLKPWMMTPVADADKDSPQERFNIALWKARSVVERCIGSIKNRWRCLSDKNYLTFSGLHGTEEPDHIIRACVKLHNLCLQYGIPESNPEEVWDHCVLYPELPCDEGKSSDEYNNNAKLIRAKIIEDHFTVKTSSERDIAPIGCA